MIDYKNKEKVEQLIRKNIEYKKKIKLYQRLKLLLLKM